MDVADPCNIASAEIGAYSFNGCATRARIHEVYIQTTDPVYDDAYEGNTN